MPTVSSALYGAFGQQAPLTVYYNSNRFVERSGRYRISDQVRAGDAVQSTYTHECEDGSQECSNTCTAAFGAQDEVSPKPNGELINAYFILTAGHCFEPSEAVFRAPNANPLPSELVKIGSVRRAALLYRASGFESDAEAIKVDNPNLVSRWIHLGNGAMKFGPAKFPEEGQTVCLSGKESNRVSCGPVIGPPEETYYEDLERGKTGILWLVPAEVWSIPGDSGSPLWGAYTGDAMGILSGGPEDNPNITLIQPLMPWVEHESEAPGALNAPEMLPLRVLCWNGPPC